MCSGCIFPCLLALFLSPLSLQIVASEDDTFETCSASQQESILGSILSCKPIEAVVPLEFYPSDNYSFVKPRYVSVQRCQGSCFSNNHHSCIATHTRSRSVDVLYFPSSSNSDGKISPTCSSVSVQDDVACACGCSISESDCADGGRGIRTYLPGECRCACRDVSQRSSCLTQGHFWNAQTCECMCGDPTSWPICPTGYTFDYGIGACHCVPPAEVASILLEITIIIAVASGVVILWAVYKYVRRGARQSHVVSSSFRSRLFSRMESENDGEELRFFVGQSS